MVKYLLLFGFVAVTSSAHAADFSGQAFDAAYRYPSVGVDYAFAHFLPPTFGVGSGIETVGDVEGVTTIDVDFAADSLGLSLKTTLANPTWNDVSFNGLVFTSASTIPFTHVALGAGTNLAGFDLSRVTLTDHQISVNWAGLSYTTGSAVNLTFSGAVPEPSSWAMMLGGFGLVGGAMRARRKNAVTFA